MKEISINKAEQIPEGFTGKVKFPSGTEVYFLNGNIHRENEPAVLWPDGGYSYYLNGVEHCDFGPSFRYGSIKQYHINGKIMDAHTVFENMKEEDKEKALWNIDEWQNSK